MDCHTITTTWLNPGWVHIKQNLVCMWEFSDFSKSLHLRLAPAPTCSSSCWHMCLTVWGLSSHGCQDRRFKVAEKLCPPISYFLKYWNSATPFWKEKNKENKYFLKNYTAGGTSKQLWEAGSMRTSTGQNLKCNAFAAPAPLTLTASHSLLPLWLAVLLLIFGGFLKIYFILG